MGDRWTIIYSENDCRIQSGIYWVTFLFGYIIFHLQLTWNRFECKTIEFTYFNPNTLNKTSIVQSNLLLHNKNLASTVYSVYVYIVFKSRALKTVLWKVLYITPSTIKSLFSCGATNAAYHWSGFWALRIHSGATIPLKYIINFSIFGMWPALESRIHVYSYLRLVFSRICLYRSVGILTGTWAQYVSLQTPNKLSTELLSSDSY